MPVDQRNPQFDDCYFSNTHGLEESLHVFINGNSLPERIREGKLPDIGETGFGSGLNLLSLIRTIQEESPDRKTLRYRSIEMYPLSPERIEELLTPFHGTLEENWEDYLRQWTAFFLRLKPGWNRDHWGFRGVDLDFALYYGDAREWAALPPDEDEGIGAWFLDGHSPEKNPEIWSLPVMQAVFDRTVSGGTLASFTASGLVKTALREAGFFIKRSRGYGTKRHMIKGIKS